jgi:hypothetical protein
MLVGTVLRNLRALRFKSKVLRYREQIGSSKTQNVK